MGRVETKSPMKETKKTTRRQSMEIVGADDSCGRIFVFLFHGLELNDASG